MNRKRLYLIAGRYMYRSACRVFSLLFILYALSPIAGSYAGAADPALTAKPVQSSNIRGPSFVFLDLLFANGDRPDIDPRDATKRVVLRKNRLLRVREATQDHLKIIVLPAAVISTGTIRNPGRSEWSSLYPPVIPAGDDRHCSGLSPPAV